MCKQDLLRVVLGTRDVVETRYANPAPRVQVTQKEAEEEPGQLTVQDWRRRGTHSSTSTQR